MCIACATADQKKVPVPELTKMDIAAPSNQGAYYPLDHKPFGDEVDDIERAKHEAKYGICGENEFGVSYFRPECLAKYKETH